MLKQKDEPQWISGKDDLHNVVAVTETQATLTQGERRRTIGFKRAGCAISEV